jgi:SulP family sulfate permease
MLTVLTLTVFVDLITAVVIGIFIKNLVTLDQLSTLQLDGVVLSNGKDRHGELPAEEESALQKCDGRVVMLRINGPLSYGVSRALTARLNGFRQFDGAIVDLKDASLVGLSTTMLIEEFVRAARARHAPVYLVGLNERNKTELARLGLLELLDSNHLVDKASEAFAQLQLGNETGVKIG